MDRTDRTTNRRTPHGRAGTRRAVGRALIAALLLALAVGAAGRTPDGADAAPVRHTKNMVKLICAELGGTYYESYHGSYGCLVNGMFLQCDSNGWCINICFETLGCSCDGMAGAWDKCVRGANAKPNPGDRWVVVDDLGTAGASAEDPPPPVRPPGGVVASGDDPGAAEAGAAPTEAPEAAR